MQLWVCGPNLTASDTPCLLEHDSRHRTLIRTDSHRDTAAAAQCYTHRVTTFIPPVKYTGYHAGLVHSGLTRHREYTIRADSSPVSLRQRHAALKPLCVACSLQIWQNRRRSRGNMLRGCWNVYLCFQKAALCFDSSTQLAVAMRTQSHNHQSTAAMTPRGHTHCPGQTNFFQVIGTRAYCKNPGWLWPRTTPWWLIFKLVGLTLINIIRNLICPKTV